MNLVYTINEPAAEGGSGPQEGGQGEGRDDRLDRRRLPRRQERRRGIIGATSQQYPLLMASMGVDAVAAFAKDGTKPKHSEGLDFFNTGATLITDHPVAGRSLD